jgi:hypothetical protein
MHVQVIAICGSFFEFFMSVMGSYGKHMKQVGRVTFDV